MGTRTRGPEGLDEPGDVRFTNGAAMKCACEAKLSECDHNNRKCPASAYRLIHDTKQAMLELYEEAKGTDHEKKHAG